MRVGERKTEGRKERKMNSMLSTWNRMLSVILVSCAPLAIRPLHLMIAHDCVHTQRCGASKSVLFFSLSHELNRKIKSLEISRSSSYRKNYDIHTEM